MSSLKGCFFAAVWTVLCATPIDNCFAETAEDGGKKTEFSTMASMEAGQFVNYKYHSADFSHKWLQQNLIWVGMHSVANQRLELFINAGGSISYNTISPKVIGDPANFANSPFIGFFIDRAEIKLHASPDPRDSLIDFGVGIFNEKNG